MSDQQVIAEFQKLRAQFNIHFILGGHQFSTFLFGSNVLSGECTVGAKNQLQPCIDIAKDIVGHELIPDICARRIRKTKNPMVRKDFSKMSKNYREEITDEQIKDSQLDELFKFFESQFIYDRNPSIKQLINLSRGGYGYQPAMMSKAISRLYVCFEYFNDLIERHKLEEE